MKGDDNNFSTKKPKTKERKNGKSRLEKAWVWIP